MLVTLIKPPAYSIGIMGAQRVPHLGIAYIAAVAREAGFAVDIIDMCGEGIDQTQIIQEKYIAYGISNAELETRLKPSKVIGFTCMFSQDWIFVREIIKKVRELAPESLLVAGGEHITAIPEYCLEDCPELDLCIVGEGESAFTEFLQKIDTRQDYSEVGSLVYRDSSQKIVKTPRMDRIRDVDSIPAPAWDLMPMENYLSRGLNYHIQRGRTIPMLATRGCPYRCTFCSNPAMWGNFWGPRDPAKVVDEIEDYIYRYQASNFIFSDLTAVIKKSAIVGFCEEIKKRNLDITWQLPTTRTESLDKDTLQLMYDSGLRDLDFAIESGSKDVLKEVLKANKPQDMIKSIRNALDVGMNLSANFILGLPKEGYLGVLKSYFLSMRLAVSGLQEINVFPFIPYPGSELFYSLCREERLKLDDSFFLTLFGYADLTTAISWSDHYSPRMLRFMRLFVMSSFYSLMFLTHPQKLFHLVRNLITGKTNAKSTKLEGVLRRIYLGMRTYNKSTSASQ